MAAPRLTGAMERLDCALGRAISGPRAFLVRHGRPGYWAAAAGVISDEPPRRGGRGGSVTRIGRFFRIFDRTGPVEIRNAADCGRSAAGHSADFIKLNGVVARARVFEYCAEKYYS